MVQRVKRDTEELPKDSDQITGELPRPIQLRKAEGMDIADRAQAEDAVLKDLVGKFIKWAAWRKPYEELWTDIYRMFLSVLKGQKTPTRAKVFIPVVFQVIESALPKLVNAVLGDSDFFSVIADDEKDKKVADLVFKLLTVQLEMADMFMKFIDFGKQLLLYGTSYFFVFWKVRRAWVIERTPIRKDISFLGVSFGSQLLRWEEKLVFKVVERRPEVEVPDIADVYPDPNSENEKVDKAEGVFIRSVTTMQDMDEQSRGKFPVYANFDRLRTSKLETAKGIQTDSRPVIQDRRAIRRSTQSMPDKAEVELLSYWGKYDLDGDGFREEVLIVIADRRVLVKAIRNPFHHQERPILRTTLFNVPKEWYGIGMVEPIIPLQHELNTLRNQRLDNINLAINRMWKVNSLADVDVDALISLPNGIILTDDMEAVQPIVMPDVTASAYNDSAIIQNDIENATAPKSVQGTPESGRLGRTARGAQLIIGQALEKFGLSAKVTEHSALKRLLRMFYQLDLQFLDRDAIFSSPELFGGALDKNTTPEKLRANLRFRMLSLSETLARESKINQLISFIQLYKDVPGFNLIKVGQFMWKLMGFNDAEDFIQSAPMPQVLNQINPQTQQQGEASVAGQARNNPSGAPTTIPGVKLPPGGQ